jgi:TolB protein
MQKYILSIIAILVLLLSADAAHSQYYLGVIQGEAKKIPIAVLDISNETGNLKLRTLALEILQADLRHSQIFEVMDPAKLDLVSSGRSEPAEEVIKRAGTFGITGVVWASLQRKGGELMLAGRLYDAASGTKMTSKEYLGNEGTFRRMIHSFADEIVSRYTGEKGCADPHRLRLGQERLQGTYSMDYDGASPMKISADRSICLSPAWSPDAQVLVYVSYRDRNPDLYGLDMETGKRWKISGKEGEHLAAWSPDETPGPYAEKTATPRSTPSASTGPTRNGSPTALTTMFRLPGRRTEGSSPSTRAGRGRRSSIS